MTSAPRSASNIDAKGAGPNASSSTIRTPLNIARTLFILPHHYARFFATLQGPFQHKLI
jgi:hypothetical protein